MVLSLNPGGTERLVVELAARLHDTMPTAVCCLDEIGVWAGELTASGIAVTALDRRPGFRPSLGRGIAAAARRHRADVIHAHHYSPFVYSCLARLAGSRAALVFTEHGRLSDAPPSPKRRLANRLLARIPGHVAAVSDELRRHLVGEGFGAGAVSVVYNGIDAGPVPSDRDRAGVRRELDLAGDAFVVGTVARLDPVKDLGTLIEAAGATRQAATVLVVGDGPERARLEALARARARPGRVTFLGQRGDARRLLAACDAYVNCSISEGISLTILEAMAATLPVVATAVGGTPEILDDSCGVLVAPRDPGAIGRALDALAADASRRRALGRAARARVEQRFTLDRMIDEYRKIYLDAAGRRERR